jgi:DNA-binding CsgD family transcriptional regulator
VTLAAALSELSWYTDEPALARKALELGRTVPDAYFGLHLATERASAMVLHAHGERVDARLPRLAMPSLWPALHELEGLRLLADGADAAAAGELSRAAEEWHRTGVRRWAVRAGMLAADAAGAAGDRTAPEQRRRWIEVARAAGLVGTLRRFGHAVHPALTLTEETVLREVAQGGTTRDVARRLGIAPDTVDQHVEAARRKLGATTRLEAALLVGR